MRKITLLLALFAISVFTFGQIEKCQDLSKTDKLHKMSAKVMNGAKAAGDTIYYEDFGAGMPAGWTSVDNTGNNFDWIYSTVGPTGAWTGSWPAPADAIGSPTAANGFMMLPMDYYNTDASGQMVTTTVDMDGYLQTSAFDFTNEPTVILTLSSEFRTCCASTAELWISVSTDGTNWSDHFIANADIPNNEWWYTEPEFNISDIAAGMSTVYIRFGVTDASHYFWEIDDVVFIKGPANDIVIEKNYAYFFANTGYYNQVPIGQAEADSVFWDCAFFNNGSNTAYNCVLDIEVEHDTQGSVYTSTSAPVTLMAYERDTLRLSEFGDGYSPQATGEYTMTYTISSDSIDEITEDNSGEKSFLVSDFVYARDDGNVEEFDEVSPQIWSGGQIDGYLFGVTYQLVADTTEVHQMQIYVQNTSEEGATIIGKLMESDGSGGYNPVLTTQEYTISWTDTSTWMTLNFELDGQSEILEPGRYLLALECYFQGFDFYVGEDNTTEQAAWATVWNDPTDPGFYYYTNYFQSPAIRMLVFEPLAPDPLVITEDAPASIVAGDLYEFTPTVAGGTPPYTWAVPTIPAWLSWDGGTGVLSGTPEVTDIGDGDVVIEVSDDAGVTDTYAFTIDIINSINENESNISVYPNPTNGLLNINNVQGASVRITNLVGELVATIDKADAFNTVDMTNFAPGTYLVKIINNSQVITKKINLEK